MFRKLFIQICLLTFLISAAFSQSDYSPARNVSSSLLSSFRLFEDEEIIEISLRFDMTAYFRDKSSESIKAEITINSGKPDSITRKIKLKTRGVFRKKYCEFPPIELNFKNADFGYSDLDSISKIKLVTQCGNGQDDEKYILREYLVYKMFNVFTDTGFRVRLLRINYIDSEKERKPIRQYGFLIEPLELVAVRTNTIQIKTPKIGMRHILPYTMDRLSIFNYMIGNYDWSVTGQHNVKVLKSLEHVTLQQGIIIPYDFDWSGVVNAHYAIPAEDAGVKNVRERIFQGLCREKEVFRKELDQFSENKDSIYRVINEFPHLKQRDKDDITRFLDEFFIRLKGNRDHIINDLIFNCKQN